MHNFTKACLLFSVLLMLCSCSKEQNYTAYFGGQVVNPRTPYVIFSKDNKVIDTIKLNKDNRFFVKFDSLSPGLYSFKHDPDYQYVYFDRNDSLMVSINTADFDQSIVFSGRGEAKNNFMMELFIQQETDRHKAYDFYNYDYERFRKAIDSTYSLREAFYKQNKETLKWSEGFDFYAQQRVKLNYYTKREYYPYVHARRTGEEIKSKLPKDFYAYRKTLNFNDSRLTDFSPFQRYLTAMLNNMAITRSYKNGNVQEDALRDNINKLNIADSMFGKNEGIKNDVLNNIAFNYLLEDQNIVNNQKFLERYLQLSTDNNPDNEIKKIGNAIKQLKEGNKLPAIALVDSTNKAFDIDNDIKKETVIFFWTSCARAHLVNVYQRVEELKKQHPNVHFIGVNVDNDTEWKKTMGLYNFDAAQQLRTTDFAALRNKWVFTKINRTIVLNSNGTIKNAFTNLLDTRFEEFLK